MSNESTEEGKNGTEQPFRLVDCPVERRRLTEPFWALALGLICIGGVILLLVVMPVAVSVLIIFGVFIAIIVVSQSEAAWCRDLQRIVVPTARPADIRTIVQTIASRWLTRGNEWRELLGHAVDQEIKNLAVRVGQEDDLKTVEPIGFPFEPIPLNESESAFVGIEQNDAREDLDSINRLPRIRDRTIGQRSRAPATPQHHP